MADAPLQREPYWDPLRNAVVRILAVIGCLAAASVLAHWLTEPNYEAETARVSKALGPTTTLKEFIAAGETAGLECNTLDQLSHTVEYCRGFSSFRAWDLLSWLEWHPRGVTAYGEFIDGRKSSEYDVRVQKLGP